MYVHGESTLSTLNGVCLCKKPTYNSCVCLFVEFCGTSHSHTHDSDVDGITALLVNGETYSAAEWLCENTERPKARHPERSSSTKHSRVSGRRSITTELPASASRPKIDANRYRSQSRVDRLQPRRYRRRCRGRKALDQNLHFPDADAENNDVRLTSLLHNYPLQQQQPGNDERGSACRLGRSGDSTLTSCYKGTIDCSDAEAKQS